MTQRLQISRREPVICLKPFKYRSRPYKPGDVLDRRRVQMPLRKLRSLIEIGNCELAKDMNPDSLAEFGFVYQKDLSRTYLKNIDVKEKAGGNEDVKNIDPPKMYRTVTTNSFEGKPFMREDFNNIEIIPRGRRWVDIVVDGVVFNEKGLKREEAEKIVSEMEG